MRKIKSTSILALILFDFSFSILAQENENIKLQLLNGNYQKVINILEEKLSEQDSLSFNEYNSLGSAYQNLMNYSKAIPFLYKANKLEPENIQNLLLLGSCQSALGKNIPAKYTYKKVLELDEYNLTAMVGLGKILINMDEFSSASDIYKKMILADSTNPYYYSQLGICELKKGNKNLAKKYFEESVKLNNSNVKTILRLAKLYYSNKQFDEAKKILQQGLMQNSQNKSLNKMLAEVFYKKKQYEEAIIKYLYLVTVGDTTAQTYQKLGLSYYYISFTKNISKNEVKELKLREGISALEKAYNKNNNNSLTALYLGLCHKVLGEHEAAIKYFNESLDKMFPDYIGEVYKSLAISNEQISNYHDAIINYKEAIKYMPSNKLLTFYLASVYDRYYKDKSVALQYYKNFLNNNNNADAKLITYSKGRVKELSREADFWGR